MSDVAPLPFLKLLEDGHGRGGFETDDVLAIMLPLMRQVRAAHEAGLVAPLRGLTALTMVTDAGLSFAADQAQPLVRNLARVNELQTPVSRALDVLGESRRSTDVDQASVKVASLLVGTDASQVTKPIYLPGYQTWEHAVGHHDELTDIFSLGLLLASLALGMNFDDLEELELFAVNRENLFAVNRRLNPVLASTMVQMTELNRKDRAPDLAEIISRLANYREQPPDLTVERMPGFTESGVGGKRRIIHSRLRERLFEISRRNRLIYFKPTLQTLNLTVASVPTVLDYRNIRIEQLFVWHPELASLISGAGPITLGKYLRFEDAPYISGVLDKIISEERRDRAEFGFAQLRLVVCFLRWNNLKEAPQERIHSPLLLAPVELTRKKGVRDNYVLQATGSELEVNPILRHHLRELYNLSLPEFVDLQNTSLDQFYLSLQKQIQASEPGVTLNKIDRPQIELIHQKARQRLDQYRRQMKLKARSSRNHVKPPYSYQRENYRPLGVQMFLQKVRPSPLPLRQAVGASPDVRLPHLVDPEPPLPPPGAVVETERQTYTLRDGANQNPYLWDFDLCSMTLGNFNYRKMTLVRDYAHLIETDTPSTPFDAIFSLQPRPAEEKPAPPLALAEQHLIIACDATQASAIARARTGTSYIIQGPPGTGKSQTITNLIADYVARGKRVLFVCEKRAAIDVVFYRLRQAGLDDLCCLIHDSQTDKKAFIQNLKQTYETYLRQDEPLPEPAQTPDASVRSITQDLESLGRLSSVMSQTHSSIGLPLRRLLHRLIQLKGRAYPLEPATEDVLPEYIIWIQHGEVVDRLVAALKELGEDLYFSKSPLRYLSAAAVGAERPLEKITTLLERAQDQLDAVQNALELAAWPPEACSNFGELRFLLALMARIKTLAEHGLLGVLAGGKAAQNFLALAREIDQKDQALAEAKKKTAGWTTPLPAEEVRHALPAARAMENSVFRFFQPSFWKLRKVLRQHYDFSRAAVAPSWTQVLTDLDSQYAAQAEANEAQNRARQEWQVDEPAAVRQQVVALQTEAKAWPAQAKALLRNLAESTEGGATVASLADINDHLIGLDGTLSTLLNGHEALALDALGKLLNQLQQHTSLLLELAPILAEIQETPESLIHALRTAEVPLNDFEAAMGRKSINTIYRQDKAVSRFDSVALARRLASMENCYREWLAQNAKSIRAQTRRNFLEHVNLSSLPAAQLSPEQKLFKKSYATGRRELEHEFGKTMRYKSIRDLAGGDSGQVIRDLKPIWLMSPLGVSDTLPLAADLFDVVIFDEASQIPIEEAVPTIFRANQVVVVGDEMQLPPTSFFVSGPGESESVEIEEAGQRVEITLDAHSLLTQAASRLPSTLLAWHYRSRYESLISFSNAAFYSGNLFTIPDRQCNSANLSDLIARQADQATAHADELLRRSISFHMMEHGVYQDRKNPAEAAFLAQLVRGLLGRKTGLSIGIVAFSEAQQSEIEGALESLAESDPAFATELEAEYLREENDQFCGLFVKNLENVQGDERDIILISVCYAPDSAGRMLMNFGPINQRGGEKRLNVIFSRAKHHMAIISSIRHPAITNDYNDGANCLKNFLNYAEAVSKGNLPGAIHVLDGLNPLARKSRGALADCDAVAEALAAALRQRGWRVDASVGQSKFRCDLAVRDASGASYQLGVLVDTDSHYANSDLLDRYLLQPSILRAFGWRVAMVLTKDWYHSPEEVVARLERLLAGHEEAHTTSNLEEELPEPKEADSPKQNTPPTVPTAPAASSTTPALTVAPPPLLNPAMAGAATTRRFELVSDESRKFWEISISGDAFTVRFGRLGTNGQSQTKTFADPAKARREAEALIAEKLKKGYVERT